MRRSRTIPGFGGKYNATAYGVIFGPRGKRKPRLDTHGYQRINIHTVNRGLRAFFVHTLVLLAFVGPCPKGMEIRHKDGNPRNNHLSNLRYGTKKENKADTIKHGTCVRGERHGMARLTEEEVRSIKQLYAEGHTNAQLAKMFKVCHATVWWITTGKHWAHLEAVE